MYSSDCRRVCVKKQNEHGVCTLKKKKKRGRKNAGGSRWPPAFFSCTNNNQTIYKGPGTELAESFA